MSTRTLVCQSCGREWERLVQRGQLPRTCPECKSVRRARAVPVVESAVASPVVESAVVEPPVERCWNCDRPTHARSACEYRDGGVAPGCCCCRDAEPNAEPADDFGVPF